MNEPVSVQATKQASKDVSESASAGDAMTLYGESRSDTLLITFLRDTTVACIVEG